VRSSRKVLAMIDAGSAERIEKLLKTALSTDKDGEVIAAVKAIRRTLNSAGSDLHELAARVHNGRKLSETEMKKIYDAAYSAGKKDGRDAVRANVTFSDVDTDLPHQEMARYCIDNDRGLNAWEIKFVHDLVDWYRPTEKMMVKLRQIYAKQRRRT
jgi:hypothetical protein